MGKAIAILIFLSLFAQCTLSLGIVGYYEVNKAYIARTLCENRAKPELKCCGRCYLRKQLKKADNPNTTSSPKAPVKQEKAEGIAFILPHALPELQARILSDASARRTPVGQHLYPAGYFAAVFHPPSGASIA